MREEGAAEGLARQCAAALEAGDNVLVHLERERDYGVSAFELARRSAGFVTRVLRSATPGGLGVAGGDTSSAIVQALGLRSLSYVAELDAGVALCRGEAAGPDLDGIPLMLKGGQMGGTDLYDRFAALASGASS